MRKMKDSGIEWIGEIPEEWNVIRNKYNFTLKKTLVGQNWNKSQLLSLTKNGVKAITPEEQSGKVPTSFSTYQLVAKNDIVMCLFDLDVSAVFSGISAYEGMISPAYKCFKCKDGVSPRYIDYYFRTVFDGRKYKRYSKNVRYSLDVDGFMALPILVPLIDEQEFIANFLDAKCIEIDALTVDIQKQIDILDEYKRSVITEAVTKGLDPNVEMKASGIPWASEIPQHWDISKIKYEIIPIQRAVRDTDGVITCFRDGEVTLRQNRREEGFTISMTEHGYHGVDVGDLVIHGMDAFAGAIGCSDSRGKITPVVHVCKTTGNNRYFMYVLRSMAANDVLMTFAEGIRVRSSDFRNFNKLGKFDIAVPTVSEQDQIVEYLDRLCANTDAVIEQKQKQLETLSDYKKSLIYEYVTGKKEVPNEYHPE